MFKRLFGPRATTPEPSPEPGPGSSSSDQRTLAQGQVDGLPLLFRFRAFPPEGVEPASFATLVAIGWSYEPGNDSGMPGPPDAERMDHLEALLDAAIETPGIAYLTAAVTGNGRREWQWYTRDSASFMAALNRALSSYPAFPIDISHQQDPEWNAYLSILAAAT